MDRRAFLQRIGSGGGLLALSALLDACGSPARRISGLRSPAATAKLAPFEGIPRAQWLIEENARAGSFGWIIDARHQVGRRPIEGYCDQVSVDRGSEFTLFANTTAATFRVEVYRMGYYQGHGGRLVTRTRDLAGRVQPAAIFTPGINRVHCEWAPSYRFSTQGWQPGNYLLLLIASSGGRHHVPVTVRDDASRAAIVVQNSVTTWQAYNLWGGFSLYGGVPTATESAYTRRSRVVSFDRPYHNPDVGGSGDWLGNEFPLLYLLERHGCDITYLTNVDLDIDAARLRHHRVLVSLGHDEYWSWGMRYGAQSALLAGLNIAFLGANACYRQIRFASSALGTRREVICYKDYLADPIFPTRPWLATGISWASTPHQSAESLFTGAMYQNFGASGELRVFDPNAFVFAGMHLTKGATLGKIVGSEFDAFEPAICPKNVQILAHSKTSGVVGYADMTYYTTPNGGGVFDSGTADFVTALWDGGSTLDQRLSFGTIPSATALAAVVENLLRVFANGPAARTHPSAANWRSIYSMNAPVNLGVDTK